MENRVPYHLNLIEPTLHDETGHGYSYTTSLIEANQDHKFKFTVWLDKRGKNLLAGFACKTEAYFIRRFRQIQKYFLYNKLMKKKENLFINTAEFVDIKICYHLLKKYKDSKVFLHFHQFNVKKNKIDFLTQINRQSNMIYLTTTPGLLEIFVKCGIKNAHMVPCSSYLVQKTSKDNFKASFDKVIFAGAARSDKGFLEVVELVDFASKQEKNLKFNIQTSPPSSGRYDDETQIALNKLNKINSQQLTLQKSTFLKEDYLLFFKNSICLLLYDISQYHNKFSGVALDAFNQGCPVVTGKNTWMGDTVLKYQAGKVVDNYKPETVLLALKDIVQNYEKYSANALAAANDLEKTHNPQYTLEIVEKYLL